MFHVILLAALGCIVLILPIDVMIAVLRRRSAYEKILRVLDDGFARTGRRISELSGVPHRHIYVYLADLELLGRVGITRKAREYEFEDQRIFWKMGDAFTFREEGGVVPRGEEGESS